ncbi:NAD-dependent epimerase/dehydratase family protein [Geomonas oryzae]|uniref:NAD(P)-dependent oxidoreductase n=1 Tax=Geomonas oryzae TaxID=2364273 RepID=UPI00100A8AE6|nr:NAD(P)-dependent oxidoreductase [Geomonas oryzae]
MSSALIGYTGYVGTTLLRQRQFEAVFRSTDIAGIENASYDCVVCAGVPAQKWIANREPEADLKNIERLMGHLETVCCGTFVLISTVDVFGNPAGVDENSIPDEAGLHPYGRHRLLLENFVKCRFENHLIVRLPGLVGPGLRKNVVFDFLNDNNLHAIDGRGVFQFYPMVNLWYDIRTALEAGLTLVHLTAEPVSVAQVSEEGFGRPFVNTLGGVAARYDFRSVHAPLFGGNGPYQYSRRESVQAIRAYAQSEPLTLKGAHQL